MQASCISEFSPLLERRALQYALRQLPAVGTMFLLFKTSFTNKIKFSIKNGENTAAALEHELEI